MSFEKGFLGVISRWFGSESWLIFICIIFNRCTGPSSPYSLLYGVSCSLEELIGCGGWSHGLRIFYVSLNHVGHRDILCRNKIACTRIRCNITIVMQ